MAATDADGSLINGSVSFVAFFPFRLLCRGRVDFVVVCLYLKQLTQLF